VGTWSSGGNLNTGRDMLSGGGSSSDAICMGGYNYDITYDDLDATEEYNGSSWSSGGDMSMGRNLMEQRRNSKHRPLCYEWGR
jgi:hypothetical protein